MKKLLLSFIAAVAAISAPATDFGQVQWADQITGIFKDLNPLFNAPVAISDNDSRYTAVAGSYNEDCYINGNEFEAIGTSSYIAVYQGPMPQWTVSLVGSATVSALTFDNECNLYVAGSFADEVTFGSTDGNSKVEEGMTVDGAPTTKENAAFIAKYNREGQLLDLVKFIPQIHPEIMPLVGDLSAEPAYFYGDGDVYFEIKQIGVKDSKLYVSAVYTGVTETANMQFDAPYVLYAFFMYQDVASASIFSLDANNFSEGSHIMKVAYSGPNGDGVFDTSACWSARFGFIQGSVFGAFVGSGELARFTNGNQFVRPLSNETTPSFIFSQDIEWRDSDVRTIPTASSTRVAYNSISAVGYDSSTAQVVVAGRKYSTETVGENEIERRELFVYNANPSDLDHEDAMFSAELKEGDISYYSVATAAVLNLGDVIFNTLGYYNAAGEGYENGDFTEKSKAFTFSAGDFSPATQINEAISINNPYGVAANDNEIFLSTTSYYGNWMYSFSYTSAGIDDITVDNSNAPVEYYNLQGVKVTNPANGLFIVRQGNSTSKQIIR